MAETACVQGRKIHNESQPVAEGASLPSDARMPRDATGRAGADGFETGPECVTFDRAAHGDWPPLPVICAPRWPTPNATAPAPAPINSISKPARRNVRSVKKARDAPTKNNIAPARPAESTKRGISKCGSR